MKTVSRFIARITEPGLMIFVLSIIAAVGALVIWVALGALPNVGHAAILLAGVLTCKFSFDGTEIDSRTVGQKLFKTGSRGFYDNGKLTLPDGKRYQIQVQLVEIGSKPDYQPYTPANRQNAQISASPKLDSTSQADSEKPLSLADQMRAGGVTPTADVIKLAEEKSLDAGQAIALQQAKDASGKPAREVFNQARKATQQKA